MLERPSSSLTALPFLLVILSLAPSATAQHLLYDHFDCGGVGAGGVNGGWTVIVLEGRGVEVTEADSELTVVPIASDAWAAVISKAGIDSTAVTELTITWHVNEVTARPMGVGYFIGLQDDATSWYQDVDNIGFSFYGRESASASSDGFAFVVGDKGSDYGAALAFLDTGSAIDIDSFFDGFTASLTISGSGWSYLLEGLSDGGGTPTSFSNSGTWTGSGLPADFYSSYLDGADHVTASSQKGQNSGPNQLPSVIHVYDLIEVVGELGPDIDIDDADADGVAKSMDACACTPPGAVVDATGCSIVDLCGADLGWGSSSVADDLDGDGVANGSDACGCTVPAGVVGAAGCTIVELCGQDLGWGSSSLPDDLDADGVANGSDACDCTPPGGLAVSNGCSTEELCPCAGGWNNHGQYLKCISHETTALRRSGAITEQVREELVEAAAESDCGKMHLGRAMGLPGDVVSLSVHSGMDALLPSLQLDVVHDGDVLAAGVATVGTEAVGAFTVETELLSADELRADLVPQSGVLLPAGHVASLNYRIDTSAGLGVSDVEITAGVPTAPGASVDEVVAVLGSSVEVVDCIGGDLFPDGAGDKRVGLDDYVQGLRALASGLELDERYLRCGDLAPGKTQPGLAGEPTLWCPRGDGDFDEDDLNVLRRFASRLLLQSCGDGGARLGRASWMAGDVAPLTAPDGVVNVSDVLLVLRWAVGIETPGAGTDEHRLADVSPAESVGGLTEALGDGALSVGDVLLLLRSAVGLGALTWPEQVLELELDSPLEMVAWSASLTEVPTWAGEPRLDQSLPCGVAEETSLDVEDGAWALTCVLEAAGVVDAGVLARVRYRAPWSLSSRRLPAAFSQHVDDALVVGRDALSWRESR